MPLSPFERERIHDAIAELAETAKTFVKGSEHYRATVILRATHLPDGDVVVSDDKPEDVKRVIERGW